MPISNSSNATNPLAPSRLQSIKNSHTEIDLLSKMTPSDFIFDFGNPPSGVSLGSGGRTVSANVSTFSKDNNSHMKLLT